MYTVTFTIDRIERGRAVLKLDDGQELIIAKRQLPPRARGGSVLQAEFYLAEDLEARRENIARYLLQEILHPHEHKKDNPPEDR